jgi:hypothetical protein
MMEMRKLVSIIAESKIIYSPLSRSDAPSVESGHIYTKRTLALVQRHIFEDGSRSKLEWFRIKGEFSASFA